MCKTLVFRYSHIINLDSIIVVAFVRHFKSEMLSQHSWRPAARATQAAPQQQRPHAADSANCGIVGTQEGVCFVVRHLVHLLLVYSSANNKPAAYTLRSGSSYDDTKRKETFLEV